MIVNVLILIRAIIGLIFGIIMLAVIILIFGKFYTGLFTSNERFGIEATVSVLLVVFLIWLYRSKGKIKPRMKKVAVDSKVLNGEYLMARDIEALIQAKNMDKGALSDIIADKRLSYSHEGQEVKILGAHPYMNYIRVIVKDTGKKLWVETDAVRVEKACPKGDM